MGLSLLPRTEGTTDAIAGQAAARGLSAQLAHRRANACAGAGTSSRRRWFFRGGTSSARFARVRRQRFRSAVTALLSHLARAFPEEHTMRRPRRLALVTAAFAAFALSGCASMHVSSYIERGVDSARFRTWDFGPGDALPTGDPRLDNNPFFKDYLEGAVGKALEARHFARTASGAPDLLVHYHANISKTFDVNGAEATSGACYGNCQPIIDDYEQGTIVLDVVDTRTNKLVWRGWAQDSIDGVIDNQESLRKEVNKAVTRMMALFPWHA